MAYARQYSVLEIKRFLQNSENRKRPWGKQKKAPTGHALKFHRDRLDVSKIRPGEKKHKPIDGAFPKAKGKVPYSDMAVAVTVVLNSPNGQLELTKLDTGASNVFIKAGVGYDGSMLSGPLGNISLRVSYKGATPVSNKLTKMNVYVGPVKPGDAALHIQTAFPE